MLKDTNDQFGLIKEINEEFCIPPKLEELKCDHKWKFLHHSALRCETYQCIKCGEYETRRYYE